MGALIKISTVWLDSIDASVGINIGSILIKSMLVSVSPLCLVHSSSFIKQQTCQRERRWYHVHPAHVASSSPLLCFVLFAAAATWLNGAKADTRARWLAVEWKPADRGKRGALCGVVSRLQMETLQGKAIHDCDTSLCKCMKIPFYFTSKKHRYQLTGPVFNWYQSHIFSKISHP